MKNPILRFAIPIFVYLACHCGQVVWAAMPVQNLSSTVPNDVQPIPAQVGSCTVPVGLSEECTRALASDCQQISSCNGDPDCMTNRPRVDISACDNIASAKPRITFKTGGDTEIPAPQPGTHRVPPSKSDPGPTPSRTTRAGGTNSDPNADVRTCLGSLSSAQSACNVNQASSFQSQLSSGQGGFGGTNAANAGVQNVNNIVLNCSNSQSICASTCGDSLASWQNQCGSDCSSSIQSAIGQLGSAKSACDGLSNNVQYLSSAANDSLNTASQQLVKNELNPASANGQPPYQAQNQIQPMNARGSSGVNCEDPSYASSYECGAIGQAAAKQRAQGGFLDPSSSNASNFSGLDPRNEGGGLGYKTSHNGSAGGQKVSPVPNGGGALPPSEANNNNGHPQGNSAKGNSAPGDSITDIEQGLRSGGYSQDNGSSEPNKQGNFASSMKSNSGAKPARLSLWSYLSRSIGGVIGKIATAFSVSEPKRNLILTQPGRLGNDGEIYMDEMPLSKESSGTLAIIFLTACGLLVSFLFWMNKKEGRKEQEAKAAFERRQAERRSSDDRRTQPTVLLEPHLERRSSEEDRRTRENRVSDRRVNLGRRTQNEEVTLIARFDPERRQSQRKDRRIGGADYENAVTVGRRRQAV